MQLVTPARLQLWFLVGVSALCLWLAPAAWNYTPDSGIYVGTAASLVETGTYRFNGHPNLLYYPGLSGLLSLTILVFGVNFHVMHLLMTGIAVACLWLARAHFPASRYGLAGLAVPVLLMTAGIFMRQAFAILSDGLFLALVLAMLLLWRRYAETSDRRALIACCIVAAAAPLVRFQGLFLCFALGVGLLLEVYRDRRFDLWALARSAAIGVAIIAPFALWTWRNWALYTADTFNMANSIFFGLHGLALYAPDIVPGEPIGLLSVYGFQRVLLFVASFAHNILGTDAVAWLPVAVWFVAVVGLAAAGPRRWFRGATAVERAFVIVALTFQLWLTLRGDRSLYIVPRYWLPVMPSVLLMVGLGLAAVHDRLRATPARHAVVIGATALLAVALVSGAARFVGYAARGHIYYPNAATVIEATADYVARNVPLEARIATTDWGVMPFMLGRESYQVLDDASHRLTLERMQRFETRYLVILDGLARFPPAARAMADAFPAVFVPVFEARGDAPGPVAMIYAVDLTALRAVLTGITDADPGPR